MILLATYRDKKVLMNEKVVLLRRGELPTSMDALSQRWDVDKRAVTRFLDLLAAQDMITTQKQPRYGTIVKISNYQDYQGFSAGSGNNGGSNDGSNGGNNDGNNDGNNEIPTNPPTGPICGPSIEVKKKRSEEVKKKDNNVPFAEFVSMTNDEYSSLVTKLGQEETSRCIEILDNYKGSSGKSYKSDYRAILGWVVKRREEERAKPQQGPAPPGGGRRGRFQNYQGRKWDYEKLEQLERLYLDKKIAGS